MQESIPQQGLNYIMKWKRNPAGQDLYINLVRKKLQKNLKSKYNYD